MKDTSWKRRMFYEKPEPEDSNVDLLVKALDAAVIITVLLVLLALYSWMQVCNLEDEAAYQRAKAENATAMLAECFNGGALYDKKTSIAYFCDKPLEVQL